MKINLFVTTRLRQLAGPASGGPKTFNHGDGISAALDLYQKTVETLLGQDSCPGASAEELELFKSQFRTSAYTCRLRSCPRATIGFKTQQLRHDHEVSHAGGFRCSFPACQYPPYSNQRSLSAHVASVHEPLIKVPRRAIRRVGNLGIKGKDSTTRHVDNIRSQSVSAHFNLDRILPMGDDIPLISEATTLHQEVISEEPRNDERVRDAGRDLDIGIGYLDIVMNRITGDPGTSVDPALFERVQASLFQNMNAMCSIAEIVDNLRDGSADALTPDWIIAKIWSDSHPDLAQELKQFIRGQTYSDEVPKAPRHCSCGEKDTEEDMIVCYNATCPRAWFHLSCVNRVITPIQDELWFCSTACEEAEEARQKEDEDASDSDDY